MGNAQSWPADVPVEFVFVFVKKELAVGAVADGVFVDAGFEPLVFVADFDAGAEADFLDVVGLGVAIARDAEDLEGTAFLEAPFEAVGLGEVAPDAVFDFDALGADLDSLGDVEPAVFADDDFAVEGEDAFVGLGGEDEGEGEEEMEYEAGHIRWQGEGGLWRFRSGCLVDLGSVTFGLLGDFKKFCGGEFECGGDEVAGEGLDGVVEFADGAVVVAAGVLDLILGFHELVHEFAEVGVGFELGVVFGDGDEAIEVLCPIRSLRCRPRQGPGGGGCGVPFFHDRLEGA